MARGYDETEVKFRLIKLLHSSKSGISGVEISEKLGINRVTMSKYLNKFAAEGTITQKDIGNLNLWFVDDDIEQLHFPDDYFIVQEKFLSNLIECMEKPVYNLVKNCINSKAKMDKIITEIILPSIPQIQINGQLYNMSNITAGGAAIAPASPHPFTPNPCAQGVTSVSTIICGTLSALGIV